MTPDLLARQLIDLAISEDVGAGDFSSIAAIPETARNKAVLLVKESCVLAGVEVACKVFATIDPELSITIERSDGAFCDPDDKALVVEGNARKILQAERLVLNFMQRMSGIATLTRKYVEAVSHTQTRILDTRKTTPGMRYFEKMAVRIGGGHNHRMGLYDMIMLKDNHIDYAGGIAHTIESCRNFQKSQGLSLPVEVEARNLPEVAQILAAGPVDRIMFDNFDLEDTKKGVQMVAGMAETESSGGITLETIASYAECGVDFISVGALTHHIRSVDLSLKAF